MKKLTALAFSIILAMLSVLMLVSCATPNSDPDKALKALENAGYEDVVKHGAFSLSFLDLDGLKWRVSGIRMADGKCDWVEIYYFEDADAADSAWDELQEDADDWFKNADPDDYGSAFACEKSGNMVYFGTENGIADAA